MSKRALKKYLLELPKPALQEQLLDLYERFPQVRTYYDFVFNPKEDILIQEAKIKISNEYFPLRRKKPKARRSTAHKYIRHFTQLGMAPDLLADLMLYNIEVAQRYAVERRVPEAFYKSMLNSFNEALQHVAYNGLLPDFKERIAAAYMHTQEADWPMKEAFSKALDLIE